MSKKPNASVAGNEAIKLALDQFFAAAEACKNPSPEELPKFFQSGYFRIINDQTFGLTQDVINAQTKMVAAITKKMGPSLSSQKEIIDLAWKISSSSSAVQDNIQQMIKQLDDLMRQEFEYFAPNAVVRFVDKIECLDVGPVSICHSDDLVGKVQHRYFHARTGSKWSLEIEGENINLTFPPTCWRVKLKASKNLAKEEAAWAIDVVMGVLRIACREAGAYYPKIGKKEDRPTFLRPFGEFLILHKDGILTGGESAEFLYMIDHSVTEILDSEKYKKNINDLFADNPKSLADRYGQGLGWLSRGRQSEDWSERLLYFFTSLEALLSGVDKGTPVAQTISRNAATVLTKRPENRRKIASQIKGLYNSRSELVHRGVRGVSEMDANWLQLHVELVYLCVFYQADLAQPHEQFVTSLDKAGYGLAWPLEGLEGSGGP